MEDIIREIQIMRVTIHPAIVKMWDAYVCGGSLWVILELMDWGALYTILARPPTLEEEHIAYVLARVLTGLEFLHTHNLVHRDIKSDNVLLNSKGEVKLGNLALLFVCWLFFSGLIFSS